ncbi:MAG: TIGR00730 family Rossman fold protein [Hyphomicrobiaceae bacterium]|nr:TIGR00730 family Rossman fold protein [Hyphomicrobiaceae bacterium]MCC0023423.1 TIGR00730 family Rossman fold protein [Hyphomicrobiaceae bacterium]
MRICVFCGSRSGNSDAYADAARKLGASMAQQKIDLVYGGGHVGLMGIVADAVLRGGGKVYGVIPEKLAERELAHDTLTELFVVRNMHERKMKMADLSDAFIAMPGGIGTLEEIFEQWTWLQLSIHDKPSAFLNVNGYYDPLKQMIEQMTSTGFLTSEHAAMVRFESSFEPILAAFKTFRAPEPKWVDLAGPDA